MKIIFLKSSIIRSESEQIQIHFIDGFHNEPDTDEFIAKTIVYLLRNKTISSSVHDKIIKLLTECETDYTNGDKLRREMESFYGQRSR